MHILLTIVGIVVGLIVLVLLLALFLPKAYAVERNAVINRPLNTVFDYVLLLRHQEQFNAWQHIDPNVRRTYTGTDGTVGFTMAWDSDNKQAGKGVQEIARIVPNQEVEYQVRFIAPFPGIAKVYIRLENTGEAATKVFWGMSSRMNYPMNALLLVMNMDKMLGKEMTRSLAMLKEHLEK